MAGPSCKVVVNWHARPAEGGCRDREQHSRERQNFFLAQNRGDDSEENCRHDEALDHDAHRLHGIVRAQFRRTQKLGKMQAQNCAEREKAKKDGEHSAPPAGSEAGGFGVAEEFVNFLLDHRVTWFCVSGLALCVGALRTNRTINLSIYYRAEWSQPRIFVSICDLFGQTPELISVMTDSIASFEQLASKLRAGDEPRSPLHPARASTRQQ